MAVSLFDLQTLLFYYLRFTSDMELRPLHKPEAPPGLSKSLGLEDGLHTANTSATRLHSAEARSHSAFANAAGEDCRKTGLSSLSTANDDVCNALPITIGVPVNADGTSATAQAGEVSPGAGTGGSSCEKQDGWCEFDTLVQNSLWFTFVAPPSGRVVKRTFKSGNLPLAAE